MSCILNFTRSYYRRMSVLVVIFGMAVCCWGQTATPPQLGDGSAGNPYEIETLDNLYWVAEEVNNGRKNDRHFKQTDDIDASDTHKWFDGEGWTPIGDNSTEDDDSRFLGNYNGNGFIIKGLYIDRPNEDYQGLFGYVIGAEIESLVLIDVDVKGAKYVGGLSGRCNGSYILSCIVSGVIIGNEEVGGLVGRVDNNSLIALSNTYVVVKGESYVGGLVGANSGSDIENCYSKSHTEGSSEANAFVGGLAGHNNNSKITKCFTIGNVYTAGNVVGGLVGYNGNSTISESYSITCVGGYSHVGGLVGSNVNSTIEYSYNVSNVTGDSDIGGLAGRSFRESKIINSYSSGRVIGFVNIGGLVGRYSGDIEYSYWDKQTSGLSESAGGEGLNTVGLTAMPNNWDNDIWMIEKGKTYPYLAWQGEHGDHNVPQMRRRLSNDGSNVYQKEFPGWDDGPMKVVFKAGKNVTGAVIDVVYTTYNWLSSVKLFPNPGHLSAYYRFDFADDNVFTNGEYFQLQLPNIPDQIWCRIDEGSWRVIDEPKLISNEADFTYKIDDVADLFDSRTGSGSVIEFAADIGDGNTLPVELSSFKAIVTADGAVQVKWVAETETNMLGYNIYRGEDDCLVGAFRCNAAIIPASNVSTAREYTYIDEDVLPLKTYYYWLQAVDLDLTYQFHGPVAVFIEEEGKPGTIIPVEINTMLKGAYPNPFNNGTTMYFSLAEETTVTLKIFDLKGRIIRHLITGESFGNGERLTVYWDGKDERGQDTGSGVYFCVMETGEGYREVSKMLRMK